MALVLWLVNVRNLAIPTFIKIYYFENRDILLASLFNFRQSVGKHYWKVNFKINLMVISSRGGVSISSWSASLLEGLGNRFTSVWWFVITPRRALQ